MVANQAAVAEDSLVIPLIDFSPFVKSTSDQALKLQTAKQVADGFQTAGFIYLKNHGIPSSVVKKVFDTSATFFKRPQEQKDKLAWTSPSSNRGYVRHGREKVTSVDDINEVNAMREANPDLKESIEIGRDDVPEFPNRWPTELKLENDPDAQDFKDTMLAFSQTCKRLQTVVMSAIALGMGLEETFFDRFVDAGDNNLRLLHYPSVSKTTFTKPGTVRAGEHSDYGTITLLFQDSRGGLQVMSPNGHFINATPIEDTIVINAGDLLARWANDGIKSTKHRVVEPPLPPKTANGAESDEYPARYSVAYFCNPNFDSFIEALPGTYNEELPKKYEGITSGDYLVRRLASTYS